MQKKPIVMPTPSQLTMTTTINPFVDALMDDHALPDATKKTKVPKASSDFDKGANSLDEWSDTSSVSYKKLKKSKKVKKNIDKVDKAIDEKIKENGNDGG